MKNTKLIYDSVHGYIEFSEICLSIIDTPQFQRLRNIKQLGACHYVFPSATHTRFQHSLGVAYLSRMMIETLCKNQPELNIDDETIENVEIAGLCHDLGHGPFSHLFDDAILKHSEHINKLHEERSCKLLEYLITDNDVQLSNKRLNIIKELIHPLNRTDLNIPNYIYQIVANVFNSIDVDKFDYLKRDSYTLGLSYSFDYTRLIQQSRVISNNICYPDKLVNSIYQIFITRWRLHTEIYTHPVVRCIEWMLVDCLKEAEPFLNLRDTIKDMGEFYLLDDSILNKIEYLNEPLLESSKYILHRIKKRDLYDYIGEIKLDIKDKNISLEQINTEKLDINKNDIILDIVKIGYYNDPVDNVHFYNLKNPDKAYILNKTDRSNLIPSNFNDTMLRIYSKNKKKTPIVKELFTTLKYNNIL